MRSWVIVSPWVMSGLRSLEPVEFREASIAEREGVDGDPGVGGGQPQLVRARVLALDRVVHSPFPNVDVGAAARVRLDVDPAASYWDRLAVARDVDAGGRVLLEIHHHVDLTTNVANSNVVLWRGRAPRMLEIVGVVLP